MFRTDTERVIPRQRINIANIIIQGGLTLFILLFFGQLIFGETAITWLEQTDLILITLFIIFFVFTGLVGLANRWYQRRKWKEFAEEMGLQVEQPSRFKFPAITGTYRSHRIAIEKTSEQRGRSRVYFTEFLITLNRPTMSTFTIQKRRLSHLNRTKTGDELIDKKLTVEISSKRLLEQIRRTRRLRQGLIEIGERARTKKLSLDDNTLHYKESSQISDIDYMRSVLAYLVELSQLITRVEDIGI